MASEPTRYEQVSRRALLKASAGLGVALVLPAACGNNDAAVFAGAVSDPAPLPTTPPLATEPSDAATEAQPAPAQQQEQPATATEAPTQEPEPLATATEAQPDPTQDPVPLATATEAQPDPTAIPALAVVGEMIVSFTYTQAAGGKNERPYIAVWIENEAEELVETISLWYQQGRRGERWLDHLDLWWERDQGRIVGGGTDDAATISSATRQPGAYAVAWDGSVDGVAAGSGSYYLCIEAAREEGPHSLIREPLSLTGTLPETVLPNDGELSGVTVRIDV